MGAPTIPCLVPAGIYDDDALYAVLGVSSQTLARARRDGELRHVRKGKRVLYLGQWVLDWLTGEGPAREASGVGR
jgi:hypothetical protein